MVSVRCVGCDGVSVESSGVPVHNTLVYSAPITVGQPEECLLAVCLSGARCGFRIPLIVERTTHDKCHSVIRNPGEIIYVPSDILEEMVYIEPIQLKIRTAGEQLSPTLEDQDNVGIPDWSETYNWALNKIVSDSCNSIDGEDVMETVQSSLDDLYQPIREVEEVFSDNLRRRAMTGFRRGRNRNVVLYQNNAVILPADEQGQLYVISEYEDDVNSIIESFKGRITNFSSIASDFGLEVDLLSGSEFAESMSKELDAEIVSRDDFDNTSEEAVYSEIADKLTRSIDSNITLRFGSDDPEVFEYDLLVHAGKNNRIVIEVKDASHEGADLDKNDLIDTPRDKTNIIKSDRDERATPYYNREINEIFVIVKHMDESDFQNQKQKAGRRDINLLRYENGDYLDSLEEKFREMVTREI